MFVAQSHENRSMVGNNCGDIPQVFLYHATMYYMMGSERVFPLRIDDFIVEIVEDFTLR
jgi:hypothetical protein